MPIDQDTVRARLSGPIASIRTAFTEGGEVDWQGTREQIEFAIGAGSETVLLTAGDSHFFALSEAEIAELTRVTVEQTRGRAMVCSADRMYPTGQAVEFARYAAEIGVDIHMVTPADWGQSSTPETYSEHVAAVAAEIPTMLVTGVFQKRPHGFALEAIRQALTVPNVMAIKDDICGRFAQRMCIQASERCAIFAGGQKINHLDLHPFGCGGYLSTLLTIKPEISHRYWAAIQANDLTTAADIIATVDMPFFDLLLGTPGGFDAGMHAMLELHGRCGRWRRGPYYNLTDAEVEIFADGLRTLNLL